MENVTLSKVLCKVVQVEYSDYSFFQNVWL